MGKYQAYPEYKNSGVEWLEDMPAHWEVKRTKAMFGLARQLVGKNSKDYQLLSLTLKGVIPRDISDGGGKIPAEFDTYQVVRPKNLIFCLFDIDETPRTIGISYHDGMITGAYNVYSALEPCVPEYAYYYFMHIDSFKGLKPFYTGLRKVVRAETFSNIKMPVPSKDEQEKIANFLDHETAKIDILIEKQQQLIKLLKEKRQAVISHAVTKGLNPNAPMRDSRVEWLGEVPQHWNVGRINLLFSESSERAKSEEELEYPVLSVSIHHGISDKELNEEELDRKVQRSEDRSLYKVVHSNYLAYNMMRAWQGGFGASKLSGLVSPAYVVCNPKTSLDSYYFELALRTSNAVTELKRFSRGITDFRLRLYWDEFKNICVPVPPADEIESILQSISDINSTYDNLGRVAEQQIKLLQERRTALISAAVTGKIDVRNWIAPSYPCDREMSAPIHVTDQESSDNQNKAVAT